jgi:hypothetical protein
LNIATFTHLRFAWTVCFVLLSGRLAPAADEGVTADQVRTTIDRACRYLLREQKENGSWPERPLYAGGLTPLVTLALLESGYSPDDEPLQKALKHLESFVPDATYTASIQTMAFCKADPQRYRMQIERNVRWLEASQVKEGDDAGMWAIPVTTSPDHTDNSMTHMAMLALYEAERCGVRANDETWRQGLGAWQRFQNSDGSWGWGPGYPGTGSMTCAGIASVLAATTRLANGDAIANGDQIECCRPYEQNRPLERAMKWMGEHFSVNRNPGMKFWHSYYLFALERVGRVTGQRLIGGHDWYREGAEMLVNLQLPTGAWPSDMDEEHLEDPLVATSFSLLFLSKGRRPLVLGHLQHGAGDDWIRHRRAVLNLVAHTGSLWEIDLAHQTVNLRQASVEELLQTPVLLLSGRDALDFSADDAKKLRMYVDRGGFLFADRSCGGAEFDAAFRRFIRQAFPEPGAELHPLSPSHPVWRTEIEVAPDAAPELWGVDASCRTAIVYCPDDLSCKWELLSRGPVAEQPEPIRDQVSAALAVGTNVLAYATNREVKFKDPLELTVALDGEQQFERGKIYIANVAHPGGCSGAPGSLWTILRLADQQLQMPVEVVPREISLTDPNLFKFNLLHFHGRTAFTLTPKEREQLREFIHRGGRILADAICSSTEFSASFRSEIELTFPGQRLERIPVDDELLTDTYGGADIRSVSRRRARTRGLERPLDGMLMTGPPQLEGLQNKDRWAIIFSPYDLSCALESREPTECEGYISRDAAKIAMNALIYLLE